MTNPPDKGKSNKNYNYSFLRPAIINYHKDMPLTLIPFNEIKGKWTYPKPGFIQWKND